MSFQGQISWGFLYENNIIANLGGYRGFALLRAWTKKG